MKVHVVVTDGDGNTFHGEAALVAVRGAGPLRHPAIASTKRERQVRSGRVGLDFSLPIRAFVKRHARGLKGPQKFTVLLARLAAGKVGAAVTRKEIEQAWNRMTELMGGRFNPAYTTRARDNGWVDTAKTGSYSLLPGWMSALGGYKRV